MIFLQKQQIRMQNPSINMAASSDTPDVTPISHEGKGAAKCIIQLLLARWTQNSWQTYLD